MKKFKKSLVINVPEDEHRQVSSPTQITYKETKQRPLLMYNQHTIASSNNNQDQLIEYEDRQVTCEQFGQFHGKTTFEAKNQAHNEPHDQRNKTQKYKKMNVIQFEEFNLQGDKNKTNYQATIVVSETVDRKDSKNNNKRQFSIQIPQNQEKDQKQQISTKFSFDIKSQGTNKPMRENMMKEPPAPSNKTKTTKTLNRHFVFPTNDEENYLDQGMKKQKLAEKALGKFISEQDHDKKIRQLNQEWNQKLENVSKSFEKERQQFYKQKSSLQKDLMIKDGQIEMLQKLITNRYSPKQGSNTYSHHIKQQNSHATEINKEDKYKTVFDSEKAKGNLYVSDEKITTMETVLLEKDLQINSLLQKINELNSQIDKKNNQLQQTKISLMKSQKTVESLRNQVFIFEKKQQSEKITKQFYKMKQTLFQVQQSSKTPKSYSRTKWQQELETQKQKTKSPEKNEYPLRGIDDLHKRLQSLKMNRIELESRGRIKSELGYPLTSKNKTKGTFDFKGKYYDRERDYINQTRMY